MNLKKKTNLRKKITIWPLLFVLWTFKSPNQQITALIKCLVYFQICHFRRVCFINSWQGKLAENNALGRIHCARSTRLERSFRNQADIFKQPVRLRQTHRHASRNRAAQDPGRLELLLSDRSRRHKLLLHSKRRGHAHPR